MGRQRRRLRLREMTGGGNGPVHFAEGGPLARLLGPADPVSAQVSLARAAAPPPPHPPFPFPHQFLV